MTRVGLVLGGGGVVGHAFHAGVLSALSDGTGWDPRSVEVVVGTSAGSIVCAMLRAGFSAADLAASSTGRPLSPEGERLRQRMGPTAPIPAVSFWNAGLGMAAPSLLARAALRPWSVRPGALAAAVLPAGRLPTDGVSSAIRALYGDRWPALATWVCAVRLDDGQRVVFGRAGAPVASFAAAVAASCAIPAFFQPVRIDGARYVDGGAHSPDNADLLAGIGLDLVIVSSVITGVRPLGLRAWTSGRLAIEVDAMRRRGSEVVVFRPGAADRVVMGRNLMDPRRQAATTARARESTLAALAGSDLPDRLGALVR